MFALELCQTTGFENVETKLYSPVIHVRRWSERINAPGKLFFTIPKRHKKANEDLLRHKRRVRLLRQNPRTEAYTAIWTGFIQDWRDVDAEREVLCDGMLQAFADRTTANNEVFNGQGSTEAFDLLSATNTAGATGITAGTGGVTTTRHVEMQGRQKVLYAWERIAQAHSAEFRITPQATLDFVSSLGSDQTSVIHIVYREDGEPNKNLADFQYALLGKNLINKVYGKAGTLSTTQSDTDSITKYGLQERSVSFAEAKSQTTLDEMASNWLSQRATPAPDFRVEPQLVRPLFNPQTGTRDLTGLDYSDISLGDLVKTTIITNNQTSQEVTKRIAEIVVNVDQQGNETMQWTLTDAGVFVTASWLSLTESSELKNRIKTLESLL